MTEENRAVLEKIAVKVGELSEKYTCKFNNVDNSKYFADYDQNTISNMIDAWNKDHSGEEIKMELCVDNDNSSSMNFNGGIKITGPGVETYMKWLIDKDESLLSISIIVDD